MTPKPGQGLDENQYQAAGAQVGSGLTDKPVEQHQEREPTGSEVAVLVETTNKVAENQRNADAMDVEAAKPVAQVGPGPSKIETFPVSDVVGIVGGSRSEASGGGGGGGSSGSKDGFCVGDLVEVAEDVLSVNVCDRGGVVRITKVNRDGTYDGMYVLVKGKMSRMPGHLLKKSELMKEGQEANGRRGRSARTRKPPNKLEAGKLGGGPAAPEAGTEAATEVMAVEENAVQEESRASTPAPAVGKKEKPSAEELQLREIEKVIGRIERHDRYGYFCDEEAWTPRDGYTGPRTYADLRQKAQDKAYFKTEWYSWITGEVVAEGASSASVDVSVDWEPMVADVRAMFTEALQVAQADPEMDMEEKGALGHEAKRLADHANTVLEQAKSKQSKAVADARRNERLTKVHDGFHEFCVTGEWRRQPFPRRQYERVEAYVPARSIYSQREADLFLTTHLDGFLGQPYNYDDTELSDSWMAALAGDDSMASVKKSSSHQKEWVESQVMSVINRIARQIQDRCHNKSGTLTRAPKVLGQHVEERPVWGIDAYTRRMIDLALDLSPLNTDAQKTHFVEKRLLPTVNMQGPEQAHDIRNSLAAIEALGRPAEVQACALIRKAIQHLGLEQFRLHPKGTGAVCITPGGIKPYEFVTEYLGELYPAWRWFEKEEAVQDAVRELGLKPTLPDFYNIMLERPRTDDRGYGIAFVDASRRANLGSSLSHSCNSNCYTEVVGRHGRLTIAVVTDREIACGEELCMDYCSYTDNYNEFLSAVCLCGSTYCRGSFLQYAGYNMFHKVLERNYGPARRFTHLLVAGIARTLDRKDRDTLIKHGIKTAAFEGDEMPVWLARYSAEVLRFIEFERRVLPFKLIESNTEGGLTHPYTMGSADEAARTVMEQRVQSLVQVLCIVHYILARQPPPPHMLALPPVDGECPRDLEHAPPPLRRLEPDEVLAFLWNGPDALAKRVHAAASRHSLTYARSLGDTPAMLHKKAEISRLIKELGRLVTTVTVGSRDEAKTRLLQLRGLLKDLDRIQGYKSRHLAAADMVLFSAHTDTFVQLHPFAPVNSPPIEVQARDLGQPVPRAKVLSKNSKRAPPPVPPPAPRYSLPGLGPPPPSAFPPTLPLDAARTATAPPPPPPSQGVLGGWSEASPDPETVGPNSSSSSSSSGGKAVDMCGSDEVVHVFTPRHEPDAIVNQLLQWFNLNVQDNVKVPELMGCCLLPAIEQVYAVEEVYGKKERVALYEHLDGKFSRMSAFPKALRKALVGDRPLVPRGQAPTFGSPLLDYELNYSWPLAYVQEALEKELDVKSEAAAVDVVPLQVPGALRLPPGKRPATEAPPAPAKKKSPQKGEELPPAPPATWVQCEAPECLKWRRLPWFVEAADLPTPFYCRLNTWRPSEARCEVPEEAWSDEYETTISMSGTDFSGLKPGDWVDTRCEHNNEWYESWVVEREGDRVLIHFHKWSHQYDEWIDLSANRFAPHMSYSKVTKDYVNRQKRARRRARELSGEDYETEDEDDDEEEEAQQQEEEEEEEDWAANGGQRTSRRRRRKSAIVLEQEEAKQAAKRARQQQQLELQAEEQQAAAGGPVLGLGSVV